jgi:hypothetical protein
MTGDKGQINLANLASSGLLVALQPLLLLLLQHSSSSSTCRAGAAACAAAAAAQAGDPQTLNYEEQMARTKQTAASAPNRDDLTREQVDEVFLGNVLPHGQAPCKQASQQQHLFKRS